MADTPRRLFIGSKGQPSAVLRSKKDEPEEDARKRLAESGWNMDAPHTFKTNEDTTGEFRVTDPKPPRKRKRKSKDDPTMPVSEEEVVQIDAGVPGNPAPALGWMVPEKGDMIAISKQEDKTDEEVIAAAKAKHGGLEWHLGEKKPEREEKKDESEDKSDKSDDKSDS